MHSETNVQLYVKLGQSKARNELDRNVKIHQQTLKNNAG